MSGFRKNLFKQINIGTEKKNFSILQKIIIFLIVTSCLIVVIESENTIYVRNEILFDNLRLVFGFLFTIEYLARVYVVGEIKEYKGFFGRLSYIFSFWAIIDLLALLPFFISGINEGFLLRLFRLLRLLSFARLGKHSEAIKNIIEAISSKKDELIFSIIIATTLLFVSSAFMYLLEGEKQPEAFGSILRSVWWAAAALTTVGYGDVTPITALGKVFAIISAFSSIGVVALPAGILAGAFSERFSKNKRKKNKREN